MSNNIKPTGLTYRDAGVDIDAGNRAVEMMKKHISLTNRPEVLGSIGGFGGLFSLNINKYKNPVLVSGTDGVGTKLKIAFLMDKHDTIGQDVVAMCVNDILTLGAEPLFFLDYLALGKLEEEKVASIVSGVAEGCVKAGCALIGGETAEMAGFYSDGEYDIAGFAVGVVDKDKIIEGSKNIKEGDVLIGISSSGIHSNGYSLVRKICFDHKKFKINTYIDELSGTLGEELLIPTKIYIKSCLPILEDPTLNIHGIVHITGGGFYDNIPRILPENCSVTIDTSSFKTPTIFSLLEEWGQVSKTEMYRTFNMGIGLILAVDKNDADKIVKKLTEQGETCSVIGQVHKGNQDVTINF
ncbi:phosphoribosylformylglycinamidine cyclo-ligase [Selenomonadales bacterium OttesenSCG-928-I06]|nr:phosphoribosylformylglycinamidine cyclo-ligase [Selenomonadales bacterium OttesenSCG-928-I06]